MATRQQLVIATVVALPAALTDLIQHAATRGACSAEPTARYTAKATGRNRVVIAGADDPPTESVGVNGSSGEPMSSHTGAGLNP